MANNIFTEAFVGKIFTPASIFFVVLYPKRSLPYYINKISASNGKHLFYFGFNLVPNLLHSEILTNPQGPCLVVQILLLVLTCSSRILFLISISVFQSLLLQYIKDSLKKCNVISFFICFSSRTFFDLSNEKSYQNQMNNFTKLISCLN